VFSFALKGKWPALLAARGRSPSPLPRPPCDRVSFAAAPNPVLPCAAFADVVGCESCSASAALAASLAGRLSQYLPSQPLRSASLASSTRPYLRRAALWPTVARGRRRSASPGYSRQARHRASSRLGALVAPPSSAALSARTTTAPISSIGRGKKRAAVAVSLAYQSRASRA